MRLISPYSAAVSAPPVRNHVAPGTSHSSTSSNSARTTSLATPRILSSYAPRRFVTSPAFRGWRSGPLSAAGAARASPTDHPRQGESGGVCSRKCSVPGRPAAQSHRTEDDMSVPAPADRSAPGPPGPGAACCLFQRLESAGKPLVLLVGPIRLRQDQPAPAMGHHDRRAGYLAPLTLLAYSRHAGWPPAPLILAGMSFVRARPSPIAPDWLPQGSPGALERVLRGIGGGCRPHGRAGPELPGCWLTVRREKTRAPSPIRPCRGSVAWGTGLMTSPAKMIPGRRPRRYEMSTCLPVREGQPRGRRCPSG